MGLFLIRLLFLLHRWNFPLGVNNQQIERSRYMESNHRFLNLKFSRFKEDARDTVPEAANQSTQPISILPLSPPPNQQNDHQKAMNPADRQKIKKIKRFLQRQRGVHHAVGSIPGYSFTEKWEVASKHPQSLRTSFMQIAYKFRWVNFAIFPLFIVQIWFISIFRVFNYDNGTWMFVLGLLLEVLNMGMKLAVLAGEIDFRGELGNQLGVLLGQDRMRYIIGNLYSLFYYCVALGSYEMRSTHNISLFLMDLVLIVYKYKTLEESYSIIRIQVIGSRYKLSMNIFDLVSNVFIMIHVFTVLLFLCTFYSPSYNWYTISPINASDNWISCYIESFYFACTTMLTVGFGDIHPTNLLEVMCILIVQLVGIMNNAYVINQIGTNLSLMHERRNTLEKDIANAQKLINFNHLGKESRSLLIDCLVNNQVGNEELSIQDEDQLLGKLNEEFKNQIKQKSHLRVVRKNLFFLTNFSRRFQYQVAKKLVKIICPPHSVLPNHAGKQRLYIIAKGIVDILTERKYKERAYAEQLIKSFQVNEQESGSTYINAIYGYASLFSGKVSRIKAIAKNFAVCFYLEHHDLLECIAKSSQDFQKYFQIKHKVELLDLPEKYQFPNITSSKEHYSPCAYFLIKRQNSKLKNLAAKTRRSFLRRNRRMTKIFQRFQQEFVTNSVSINQSLGSFPSVNIIEEMHRKQTMMSNFVPQLLNSPFVSKPRNLQTRQIINRQVKTLQQAKFQQKIYPTELFLQTFRENWKQYKNYYPKGNLSSIIQKNKTRKSFTPDKDANSMSKSRLAQLKDKRKRQTSGNTSDSL